MDAIKLLPDLIDDRTRKCREGHTAILSLQLLLVRNAPAKHNLDPLIANKREIPSLPCLLFASSSEQQECHKHA